MKRTSIPIEDITQEEKFVFIGVDFEGENAYIMLDRSFNGKLERLRFEVRDKVFSISRFKARFCAGRYNILELEEFPCPTSERINDGSNNHCIPCFREIGFNPFFYNNPNNELSVTQRRYHALPHNVYLAYFGSGVFKVGISSVSRTQTRLHEQGARASYIIKSCSNAEEARYYENMINTGLEIPESIRSKTKRNLLTQPYQIDEANSRMIEMTDRIQSTFNISLDGLNIEDYTNWYFGDHRPNLSDMYDMSDRSPQSIGGKCIGLVGKNIIFEDGGSFFCTDLNQYRSHIVRISPDHVVDLPIVQKGLFNF